MKNYTLKEAVALNAIMQEETDELKKKELRDELITGTLHIPESYVNKLPLIEGASFDKDDLISSAYEIWVELIDSDVLSKRNRVSLIDAAINGKLPRRVLNDYSTQNLVDKHKLNKEITLNILYKYIDYLKTNAPSDEKLYEIARDAFISFKVDSFTDTSKYMLESQFDSGKLFANKECDLENTFLFVKSAIELLGDDLSNLSIRRFEYLYSLINEAINPFESHIQDYKESVTTEDRVIDNLIDKEVKDMINEKVLSRLKTDIEKEIYDTIYNNGCITRDELMEKYNVNKTKYNNYAGRVSRVLLDVASKIKINNPEYIPEYISMPKQKRR